MPRATLFLLPVFGQNLPPNRISHLFARNCQKRLRNLKGKKTIFKSTDLLILTLCRVDRVEFVILLWRISGQLPANFSASFPPTSLANYSPLFLQGSSRWHIRDTPAIYIYIYIYICVCVCVCVRQASPGLAQFNVETAYRLRKQRPT